MWSEAIEEYILSHSDDEGELLAALNRDANVNLLRPRMSPGGRDLYGLCDIVYGGGHGAGWPDPYDRDQ